MSGGKRLFLASLQQTCNEYLYSNINKSKLAFLLQKSSGEHLHVFHLFHVLHVTHVTHVLQSGIAGFNEFCSPDICIEILSPRSVSENQEKLCIPRECTGKYYPNEVYQKISYVPRECIGKYYPRRV